MEAKMGAGEFEDGMQCSDHPYRNNLGGICAFCLQEKLGKLVSSSSFPFALASPSSPRSFRSDVTFSTATAAVKKSTKIDHERNKNRMISFLLLTKKSKNKKTSTSSEASLRRSNSTTRAALGSPRRRGSFWSFLSSRKASDAKSSNAVEDTLSVCPEEEEDDGASQSMEAVSLPAGRFDGKVSRSRSVGCGSRSFSGDLFDRISTGFGDCALRRVESQREGRPSNHHHLPQPSSGACIKERVKCAGIIFGGFSSSSSSSSSSYKPAHLRHHKTWNWAFPSPIRPFTRPPSTKYSNTDMPSNSNNNLAAIPSLLAVVRG